MNPIEELIFFETNDSYRNALRRRILELLKERKPNSNVMSSLMGSTPSREMQDVASNPSILVSSSGKNGEEK